ncbi:MAG: inorganic phosphate transporter [Burkholderiales bacterium]
MSISFEIVVFLILVALAFDFMNGFHDAANSIATVVSTRVLRPHWAVIWAAFFNFVALLVFGLAVAATIGKGIVDPKIVDHYLVFGALVGAIVWNIITWYYGIPSSSSHALIGGVAGAAVAKGGVNTLVASGFVKIGIAIVLSPLLGLTLGALLMIGVSWLFRRATPRRVDRWFRRVQLISAALYSLGHGGNDAQKTIGIVWMLLIASGLSAARDPLPFWVVILCYGMIALGTLFGGWRIVKTMGQRITPLKPVGGFCAETSGAIMLFVATSFGVPVSTTHTITGSIIGVGSVRKLSAVRWGVAGDIVWAWILTIPCSAFIAGLAWWLATHYF